MSAYAGSIEIPMAVERSIFGHASVSYIDSKSILTPASGFMRRYKYTLNPYGGCAFACEYCYARFFALTAARRQAWGNWLSVKRNGRDLMIRACRSGAVKTGDAIYMSSVTDPYQPIEHRLGLTRAILRALLECKVQPRLTIQTRSPLATRDIDLFRQFDKLRVNFTINTDSENVRLRYEPHSPSIAARFRAATQVAAAGVRIGVSVSPMLPIRGIEAFGLQLASLGAETYSTQYLKSVGSWFAAGSTSETLRKAQEDGWGIGEYRRARESLARVLGEGCKLFEGSEGYAPIR